MTETGESKTLGKGNLKAGAIIAYAAVAFNAVAGLLYTPWMVQTIGADLYGLYTLAMSVVNFFLLDLGLGSAVSRYISNHYAENRLDKANDFMRVTFRLYLTISTAIFIILLLVFFNIDVIYENLGAEQLSIFKILYMIVAIYSVISLPCASFDGVLTANEQFIGLNTCNLLQKISAVALIIIALIFGGSVYALVLVNAGTGLFFALIKYLLIRKDGRIRFGILGPRDTQLAKEVLGFSVWVLIAQVGQRFMFSIIPSVIAAVSTSWEIAVFGLAASLEGYVWTVADALNSMFMPKVTQILHSDNMESELFDFASRVGRIQLIVTGGIVIAFAALGQLFVNCWVGEQYTTLWLCSLILMLPEIVHLPTVVLDVAIISQGHVRGRGIVYLIMAATNLIIGIPLTALSGAIGACISICIAYLVRTFGLFVIYVKALHVKPVKLLIEVFSRWIFPAIVTVGSMIAVNNAIGGSGWGAFALECLAFVAIYAILLLVFMLNKREKEQLRQLIANLRPK